jgi:hypothetical protein
MSEQTTDDGVVTIPEVTVEGDPTNADPNLDANLRTYFTYGLLFGYEHPGEESGIPLDEPYLSAFREGAGYGTSAARGEGVPPSGSADPAYTGPTIGPWIDGTPWEDYQREQLNLLEEIFHQHMPHTENEGEALEPLPDWSSLPQRYVRPPLPPQVR